MLVFHVHIASQIKYILFSKNVWVDPITNGRFICVNIILNNITKIILENSLLKILILDTILIFFRATKNNDNNNDNNNNNNNNNNLKASVAKLCTIIIVC